MVSSLDRARSAESAQRALIGAPADRGSPARTFIGRAEPCGDAMVLLDLDEFESFNERYGIEAGDLVLDVVGERLIAVVRAVDTVTRLRGDEFAVRCRGCTRGEAMVIADRLRNAVTQPVTVGSVRLGVDVSVGVAHTSVPGREDRLVEQAQLALARAKREGRNRVELNSLSG